jgi:hypothetical protein
MISLRSTFAKNTGIIIPHHPQIELKHPEQKSMAMLPQNIQTVESTFAIITLIAAVKKS